MALAMALRGRPNETEKDERNGEDIFEPRQKQPRAQAGTSDTQ